MKHRTSKGTIMVVDVLLTFEDVFRKPYFAVEYLDEIRKANLLLIPSENIREGMGPVYPELTSDFLRYLKDNAPQNVKVDIAVDDDHYQKLVLRSAPVALATLLIREEVLEQAADLVIGFLSETAKKNQRAEEEMDTFVNIIVDGKEFNKKIMYSGRVSELQSALDTAIKNEFHEVQR